MTTPIVSSPVVAKPRSGNAPHALTRLVRSPRGALGLFWLVFLVVASVTADLWIPYPVIEQNLQASLQGPSAAHWLGTDQLGRDLLSRIFAAGAGTLGNTFIAAFVAVAVATPLALIAASAGRRTESVINRTTEVIMSIPAVIIMLAVIAAIGTNLPVVMAILGFLISAGMYRVFLGQAKSLQAQLYVDAATVDGLRPASISLKHVLPNMATTIFVQFVLVFAIGLMIQAGLAFIGFGPTPPEPSWGGLIQEASSNVYTAPWLMVPTGLVLVITVLAANAVADTLAKGADAPPPQIALGPLARRRPRAVPAADSSNELNTLQLVDLTVGIDDGPVLVSKVSLDVSPGSVLGIVGESGCGKTLTALSTMGLLPLGLSVVSGSILWNGRDLAGLTEKQLSAVRGREIGFVGQEPMRALDPMFTVEYQLVGAIRRLQGIPRSEARVQARSLLEQVGIVDAPRVLSLYAHQISGGMAQRVAIALALAGKPKLLVADEPTTALDVTVQAEILSLLRALVKNRGMSMVIVTHDLGVVADICDEVAVMYAGQVVESGWVTSVLDDPQHPYTMALLAADPHTAVVEGSNDRLASIPGQVPQPSHWPTGCRFAARCQFATDACLEPIPLDSREGGGGEVRCVRSAELHHAGIRWSSEPGAAPFAEEGAE